MIRLFNGPARRFAACALATALAVFACGSPEQARQPPAPSIAVPVPTPALALRLPRKPGSIRFAAIGDAGRGNRPQHEVAARMVAWRAVFSYDFVIMLGDNVYDGGTAADYRAKFELPYKPLLDAGVRFFAAIGNHDDTAQPHYRLFNMKGQRYYTFTAPRSLLERIAGPDVQFFVLDTERLDIAQQVWIDRELARSRAAWKIPVFHRPIYTSGRYARPARALRFVLEPLFVRHGVKVAFSGHEHFYERTVPQQGITYFISGAAGSLRLHDIRQTVITAKGFDLDYHFMLVEIAGDALYFQAVSRPGASVDEGVITRGTGPL